MSILSTSLSAPAPAPLIGKPRVRLNTGDAPHRFTRSNYYKMAEIGLIGDDDRIELLDGVIVEMSPVGYSHGGIVDDLNEFFADSRKGRYRVRVQSPQDTSEHSEPEPDLQLLHLREDRYRTGHPRPENVYLVIEVADSSLKKDLGLKMQIYAAAGIIEYWVVDVLNRKLIVHTDPDQQSAAYNSVITHGDSKKVAPTEFADCEIDLAWLFGPKEPPQDEG